MNTIQMGMVMVIGGLKDTSDGFLKVLPHQIDNENLETDFP